ncbi:DUF3841 domain-containing protein [Paenibacillus kandeliae]|uniref:DUF3841 domain-containing protein n=1 Tax=Paenibacillus kandeliae TaxID=3231269 RepID=UPI00345A2807
MIHSSISSTLKPLSTTKYWTVQSLEAWDAAQRSGFLHGHPEHIMFMKPYHWMMSQMGQRLPGYDGSYPVWVWPQQPDLQELHHYTGRQQCVCLTLRLQPEDVLLSDFEEWHAVLNDTFNARNHREWQRYRAGYGMISKEQSWQRIFDTERPDNESLTGQSGWRQLQGVTGAVPLEQVIRVEHLNETSARKRYDYV